MSCRRASSRQCAAAVLAVILLSSVQSVFADDGRQKPQLSPEDLVAKCEGSVATIRGRRGGGTGFIVRAGILATNAHVINEEFSKDIEAHFPSAAVPKKGPMPVELLYVDTKVDLALLRIRSDLPPLNLARPASFRKGQEITVIGNPAYGGSAVRTMLQNAVTRGLMSTKTEVSGRPLYQMSISINPGNSGGPVIASDGSVVGVVVARGVNAEGIAFCIPVDELHKALAVMDAEIARGKPIVVKTRRDSGDADSDIAGPAPPLDDGPGQTPGKKYSAAEREARLLKSEKANQALEKSRDRLWKQAMTQPDTTQRMRAFDNATIFLLEINRKYCQGELTAGEAVRIKNGVKRLDTQRWMAWMAQNVADLLPPKENYPSVAQTQRRSFRTSASASRAPKVPEQQTTIGESWTVFIEKLEKAKELPALCKTKQPSK